MDRLNFSFYDPVPTIAPPNDDLELQLVWLHLVENSAISLTQADFAKAWLDHIHYMWDEYGRTRWNLRRGVPVECVGTFENPFHDGMGSPIRSEIWACLFPGDPDSASHYAALDASLDHGTEGIAGEVLFAVMQSSVAAGESLEAAITLALRYIPGDCETAHAIGFIRKSHRNGVAAWDCWKALLKQHGSENFTYAPLNVALTIWALLYGAGDFEKSVLLAVNGGYDTVLAPLPPWAQPSASLWEHLASPLAGSNRLGRTFLSAPAFLGYPLLKLSPNSPSARLP